MILCFSEFSKPFRSDMYWKKQYRLSNRLGTVHLFYSYANFCDIEFLYKHIMHLVRVERCLNYESIIFNSMCCFYIQNETNFFFYIFDISNGFAYIYVYVFASIGFHGLSLNNIKPKVK